MAAIPLQAPSWIDQAKAESPGAYNAPIPLTTAVARSFDSAWSVHRTFARGDAVNAALMARDQQIQKAVGHGYIPPGGLQEGMPSGAVVGSPQYEQWVDQERASHPDAMAGIPPAEAVRASVGQRLTNIDAGAAQGAQQHPIGAALGGLAAVAVDPVNLGLAAATGGVADGLPIAAKLLASSAIWGGATAAQVPFKRADAANNGGPAYTSGEAVGDVVGAAVGAPAAEVAGMAIGAAGKAVLRRLAPDLFAGANPGAGGPSAGAGADVPPGSEPPPSSGPTGAGDASAPPPQPSTSTPADQDIDGRYPTNADGHIVSDGGGPIQFDTQLDAAKFAVKAQAQTDQRFQVANHPDSGFTLQEHARAAPEEAAAAPPPGAPDPDEVRGAETVVSNAGLDQAATGPVRDGVDFEAGTSGMAQADTTPPPIEPIRDIDTLEPDPPEVAQVPPADAGPGVQVQGSVTQRGRTVYPATFDPAAITPAPDLFQYKGGGDAAGVTARLQGVQTWDPLSAGQTMVWQDPGGNLLVADGHQRLGLAQRLADQNPQLNGFLFRAEDGWSSQDVRTLAALKNIREGSGTALDAAKVFRDDAGSMNDDSLPVSGDFIAQAKGLARLSDDAFGAVVNKVVPERYASLIGNMAPDRPDLHSGIVNLIAKAKPANIDEARSLVSESLQDDWLKQEGDTADMFGGAPPESTIIARAKIKASILRSIRGNARLFATLTRNADAIEGGGNVLARDANEANLAVNRAAEAMISKLAMRSGDVGDAMAEAARKVTDGAPVAEASKDVLAKVTQAIRDADAATADRQTVLDPAPPSPDALKQEHLFGEVAGKGQEAQLAPKAEDAEAESASLFDDIKTNPAMDEAAKLLKNCAPE